jgi:hypothetical protein
MWNESKFKPVSLEATKFHIVKVWWMCSLGKYTEQIKKI